MDACLILMMVTFQLLDENIVKQTSAEGNSTDTFLYNENNKSKQPKENEISVTKLISFSLLNYLEYSVQTINNNRF